MLNPQEGGRHDAKRRYVSWHQVFLRVLVLVQGPPPKVYSVGKVFFCHACKTNRAASLSPTRNDSFLTRSQYLQWFSKDFGQKLWFTVVLCWFSFGFPVVFFGFLRFSYIPLNRSLFFFQLLLVSFVFLSLPLVALWFSSAKCCKLR